MEVEYVTLQEMMDDARAEGIEQGREQERINSIKLMLTKLSPEEILEMGFSEEEIKAAQKQQ